MPITRTDSHVNGCIIISMASSSQQGDTALMLATKRGINDIVKLLLHHKADINKRDKVNKRRLHICQSLIYMKESKIG